MNTMRRRFRSLSAEGTEALGHALGEAVPAGTVLTLDGDLGAGKTTFVRGLALGLGIEEGVASPTYTLMQQHDGGRLPLFHFDAWMEGREKALLADGADEFLGTNGVAVIEWAGRVAPWLPSPRLAVRLRHDTLTTRWVEVEVDLGAEAEGGVDGVSAPKQMSLQEALEGLLGGLTVPQEVEEPPAAGPLEVSGGGPEPSGPDPVEGP